jgi:general secretion pathway protein G
VKSHCQQRASSPTSPASALASRLSPLGSLRGFTLIELLIVIAIIALLVGLLLPAIWGVMITARDAEVRVEISQLDTGITAFKAEYGGIAPPSRITIDEQGGRWNDPQSRAIIRRLWPQFNFNVDRHFNDDDGNGVVGNSGDDTDDIFTLNGAECLVFFLGGVFKDGALVGFSKNPSRPFQTGGSRVGPFFEFDLSRVKNTGGLDNAPEYLDPLPGQTNPYVYFSSRDGRGYKNTDSARSNFYTQKGGSAAFKPNTHQIISPGADGEYGDKDYDDDGTDDPGHRDYPGGEYDPDDQSTVGEEERDNITNFTNGRLVP